MTEPVMTMASAVTPRRIRMTRAETVTVPNPKLFARQIAPGHWHFFEDVLHDAFGVDIAETGGRAKDDTMGEGRASQGFDVIGQHIVASGHGGPRLGRTEER